MVDYKTSSPADNSAVLANAVSDRHPNNRLGVSVARRALMMPGTLVFLAAALVFLAYLPLAFFRFGFLDDYANMVVHGFRGVNPYLIDDGRLLGGLLCTFMYTLFDHVSGAAALRLLGLVYLVISLVMIQRAMLQLGFGASWAALAALLFAVSPTVQNWVVWGVSAWQLPALVFGLAAFFPWRHIVDAGGRASPRHIVLFLGFQLIAMLIYQPFALAAWPLILLSMIIDSNRPYFLHRFIVSIVLLAIVLLLTWAIVKTIIWFVLVTNERNRTALLSLPEIPERIYWFLTTQVTFVLSYVCEAPVPAVYWPALGLIVCGLLARATSVRQWLIHLALLGGTCLIAGFPSLIAAEHTSIRSDVVLALLACLTLVLSLRALVAGRLAANWSVIPAALVVVALAHSAYTVVTVNAMPQARELGLIEALLARQSLPLDRPIVLVGLPIGASLVHRSCSIVMIGCANSAVRYALPNIVRLWLREHGQSLRPNALFFAQDRRDRRVFSFEQARSALVAMPANPFFLDVGAAVANPH